MGFYLTAATLNQAALAQGQARRAAVCWIACAAASSAGTCSRCSDEFRRVEVGFALAAAILCGLLVRALPPTPPRGPRTSVRPDSPQELEARLAAADEAG